MNLARLVAVMAVLWLLGSHWGWRHEPFDTSLGGVTSGEYYGLAARSFDRHGLFVLRGKPRLFHLHETHSVGWDYLNHPMTPHLLTYPAFRWFGQDEAALRLPILGLLVLALVSITYGLRRTPLVQAWTLTLVATTPLLIQYGDMVDAPMFCLATMIPTVFSWISFRAGRTSYRTYAMWAFIASLTDWFAYFIVPAALVDLLIRRGESFKQSLRLALTLGMPFGCGLLIYLLWLLFAVGPAGTVEQVYVLAGVPAGTDTLTSATQTALEDYSGAMSRFLSRGYGWLWPWVAVAAFLSGLFRRTDDARAGWILLLSGILPSLAFRSRAAVHEFWSLTALPGLALCVASSAAAVLEMVSHRFGRRGQLVAIGTLLLAIGAYFNSRNGLELRQHYHSTLAREIGQTLNSVTHADDVIFWPDDAGPLRFYANASVMSVMNDRDRFLFGLKLLRPGKDQIGDLWFAVPTHRLADHGWTLSLPLETSTARELNVSGKTAGRDVKITIALCQLKEAELWQLLDT